MLELTNQTKSKIDKKRIQEVVELFLKHHGKIKKTVSVVFISDETIKKFNKMYRHKDEVTDVLSFEGSGDSLGEILIDYAQIKRQAKEYSDSVEEELIFILVHGLLHLLGLSDETDEEAEQMDSLGRKFIKKLKYKPS